MLISKMSRVTWVRGAFTSLKIYYWKTFQRMIDLVTTFVSHSIFVIFFRGQLYHADLPVQHSPVDLHITSWLVP